MPRWPIPSNEKKKSNSKTRQYLFGMKALVEFHLETDDELTADVLIERGNELLRLTKHPVRVSQTALREWVLKRREEKHERYEVVIS